MIQAVERFNHEKQCRLVTYASWWIRQYILNGIKDSIGGIRIPRYRLDRIFKKNRLVAEFLKNHNGQQPEEDYVKERMNISDQVYVEILDDINLISESSLDAKLGDDDDSISLSDVVGDCRSDMRNLDLGDRKKLRIKILSLFRELNELEQEILSLSLIEGFPVKIIAEKMQISKGRVDYIYNRAYAKFKQKLIPIYKEERKYWNN